MFTLLVLDRIPVYGRSSWSYFTSDAPRGGRLVSESEALTQATRLQVCATGAARLAQVIPDAAAALS